MANSVAGEEVGEICPLQYEGKTCPRHSRLGVRGQGRNKRTKIPLISEARQAHGGGGLPWVSL